MKENEGERKGGGWKKKLRRLEIHTIPRTVESHER